jgi:hypothetical protein
MLTRREVLIQLKTLGVREVSLLKLYLRDIEKYMETNYGMRILKRRKRKDDVADFGNDHFHPRGLACEEDPVPSRGTRMPSIGESCDLSNRV